MKRDFQIPMPLNSPVSRRDFLSDLGLGFTGLSLGAMLFEDGVAKAASPAASPPLGTPPDGQPHFPSKTKAVIWIFLSGGYSHVETFDPKPALNKYAGMTFDKHPGRSPPAPVPSESVCGACRT